MKQNMGKNKSYEKVMVIAFTIILFIIVFIIAGLFLPDNEGMIQGEIESTDYRMSSKVPARLMELRVKEGDPVKKGDTLAILSAPDLEAKLAQAKAAEQAALAMSEKIENGTRTEQIQGAFEMWQKAKAGLVIAEKTYMRLERLFDEGVMSEQKRDEAKANYEAMLATEKATKAQYDMAVNGAQHEDKEIAKAQMSRMKGIVDEIYTYMNETCLISPCDGQVTEIYLEIGELIGTGAPIMNIAASDEMWFTFNIREDLLPGITIGNELEIYVPAIDKSIPAKISLMKDVGSFAVWKATKSLDGFDLKTFEVQATPLEKVSGLHTGMSAVIENKVIKNER